MSNKGYQRQGQMKSLRSINPKKSGVSGTSTAGIS